MRCHKHLANFKSTISLRQEVVYNIQLKSNRVCIKCINIPPSTESYRESTDTRVPSGPKWPCAHLCTYYYGWGGKVGGACMPVGTCSGRYWGRVDYNLVQVLWLTGSVCVCKQACVSASAGGLAVWPAVDRLPHSPHGRKGYLSVCMCSFSVWLKLSCTHTMSVDLTPPCEVMTVRSHKFVLSSCVQ